MNFRQVLYYHVYSTTMDPCSMANDAYVKAQEIWLCTECGHIRQGFTEIDTTIQDRKPDNTPLNFVQGTRLGIAQKDFLLALGEETVRRHLYLGRLFCPDGKLLDKWVTFHGRRRLIVRGSKHVAYRKCPQCGEHVYFAMGKKYLFPQPPNDVEIFDALTGGLVLTEQIFRRINVNQWHKLAFDKLPVLTEPKDGLPEYT